MIIENSKNSLTLNEIQKIEIRLGIKFPVEYKNFLLKYNGGVPQPNTFCFYDTENRLSNSLVMLFYSICDDCEVDGNIYIEYTYFKSSNRIPHNILPIASDPFGNFICLSIASEDVGQVYFWDHELEPQDGSYENLSVISNTFQEFINSLK